jgi:putative multiple sugar transport system permease protein
METLKKLIKNNMRQYTMLIFLILIMIIFQVATSGVLLLPMNVTNLVLQNAYVFILAIGMMLLLINGGNIDLAVGSVVAFIGAITGIMIISMHWPVWVAIVISLLIGVLIGIWQGFWIAYIRIPGFIVTLAGMLIFRGMTNAILKGQTLAPFPDSFSAIGAGYIPDFIGGANPDLNITAITLGVILAGIYIFLQIRGRAGKQKYGVEVTPWALFLVQVIVITAVILIGSYWLALYKGLPIIFLIIGILIIVYNFFTSKTVPGRYIYAMGGNEKAAKLSGINTNKVLFLCYVNMSVLAAVAGIVAASRINSASPLAGQNYEMDAISSCFIGGASMYGGAGTVVGAIIGALFMGVLNNGMSILGASTDVVLIVKGLVLLLAVAFDIFSKSRAKAS